MLPAVTPLGRLRSGWLALAAASALLVGLPGCTSNFLNQNDRLRRENLHLRDTVSTLERQLAGREAYIREIQQQKTPDVLRGPGAQGVEVPRLVMLAFDRFSGVLGAGAEGKTPVLRLYVNTQDQEGRFLPVAGQASVQVVSIRIGQPPVVVAQRTFTPLEFDQAFRSGMLTSAHYTLDIPLPPKLPAGADSLTVKLSLLDAATGATITKEGVFPVTSTLTTPAVE